MKTLVLYASPTIETENGSISQKATKYFLEAYKEKNQKKEIIEIDLNKEKNISQPLNSKLFLIKEFYDDGVTKDILKLLSEVEHLIVSTSMINFNVPAVLKNWIDRIAVAGKTFKYKYDGSGLSEGLLTNISVQIIATQGAPKGWYPFGDHVKYLEGTFNFLGMNVKESILIDGTKTKEFNQISIEKNINKYIEEINKASNFK